MLYFTFKLLLSLIIGNWVYSEAVLMVPQVEHLARGFYRNVRIPTHNEWPAVLSEEAVARMEREIAPARKTLLPRPLGGLTVFGQEIRDLWRGWSFSALWGRAGETLKRDFLTGEEIFISPQESRRIFYIREVQRLPVITPAGNP